MVKDGRDSQIVGEQNQDGRPKALSVALPTTLTPSRGSRADLCAGEDRMTKPKAGAGHSFLRLKIAHGLRRWRIRRGRRRQAARAAVPTSGAALPELQWLRPLGSVHSRP